MFKRQRTGSVVCPGCGYLVGVNDDRCYNCGRANPSLWGFSPLIRSLGQDLGFIYVIMGGTITLYVLTLVWSGPEGVGGGLTSLLAPSDRRGFHLRCERRDTSLRVRTLVDRAQRGMAARRAAPHRLQSVVGAQLAPETAELYGPGRTVIIYTAASIVGFTISSVMGCCCQACPSLAAAADRRRVGADLRAARRAGLLLPPDRQPPGRVDCLAIRGHPVRLRPHHARRRQLGARRRVCRRIRRGLAAQSIEGGAHRSPHWGRRVPRCDRSQPSSPRS